MPRTYVLVSRNYDADTNQTTFVHRLFSPDGWAYTRTVRRGKVNVCKL